MTERFAPVLDLLAVPEIQALLLIVGSVVAAKLIDVIVTRLVRRLVAKTHTDLDDRLIGLLHRPIFVSVVLVGLFYALPLTGIPDGPALLSGRLIKTLALFIWLVALLRICSTALEALSRLANRVAWLETRTVPLFDNMAKIVLVGGALYGLLVIWNLDVKPWLASAGIVGIAVGFAAKDTLANLFGGLFVIIDAPYTIGDFINLGTGERGQVTGIGLRSTRILTRDDVEVIVPNAQIANSTIVNESGGRWIRTRVAVQVGVAYGSDVTQVRTLLMQAASSVECVLSDPEPRIRFREMGDSALIFQVQCWIDEPVLRGRSIDGLNTAIYETLNEHGVTIPFPQRDLHIRTQPPPATS